MPLLIPIQAVPAQTISCLLAGQNCQIAIYQKGRAVFVDLNSNGTDMCIACLAHNGVALDSCNSYDGFSGNLYFIDTQGSDDPSYTGFGTRWFLIYLTAAEVALTVFEASAAIEITVMTLAAQIEVTSDAPGNFSVAHGLATAPFLIEILPTSPGSIWAQASFADNENLYLAASDTGITATIMVFTSLASGVSIVLPATTLNVSSSAPGNFSVAHGLAAVPSMVELLPASAGAIWLQDPAFDATNVYLVASDADVGVTISVYAPTSPVNLQSPAKTLLINSGAPGDFSVEHGLGAVPSRIEILMISPGSIWVQSPAFDGTNVYLEASDTGILAVVSIYA